MDCGCGDGCSRVTSEQSPSKLPPRSRRFHGLAAHREAFIERFEIAALPRAALCDEERFDISCFQPTANFLGYELRAGVFAKLSLRRCSGVPRTATRYCKKPIQEAEHIPPTYISHTTPFNALHTEQLILVENMFFVENSGLAKTRV